MVVSSYCHIPRAGGHFKCRNVVRHISEKGAIAVQVLSVSWDAVAGAGKRSPEIILPSHLGLNKGI